MQEVTGSNDGNWLDLHLYTINLMYKRRVKKGLNQML